MTRNQAEKIITDIVAANQPISGCDLANKFVEYAMTNNLPLPLERTHYILDELIHQERLMPSQPTDVFLLNYFYMLA